MKVVREKKDSSELKAITFRFPKVLLEQLRVIADKHEVSQQKLVTAILKQALNDKSFSVVVPVRK